MTHTTPAHAPSMPSGPRRLRGTRILSTVGLLALLLAACGQRTQVTKGPVDSSPYPGWHTIPTPTSEPLATYVSSPTVPGLMLACVGIHLDQPGQAQFGPAHLWRTWDYGAHWQQLNVPAPLRSGCGAIFIRGSKDLVMLFDWQSRALLVSPDVGDTWKPIAPLFADEIAPNRFTSMQATVYRDGHLSTSLIFNARVGRRFASSDDNGRTWMLLDQIPPVAVDEIPIQTDVFAPDYSAPKAWFRTSLHAKKDASLPHFSTLDRSTDDGRTWTAVSAIGVAGTEPPQSGSPLATNPAQPARLCVGLGKWTSIPGFRKPLQDLVMGSSSDGGATWRYEQVTHVSADNPREGSTDGWMDAQGNCYTITSLAYVGRPITTSESSLVKWPATPGAEPYIATRVALPGSAYFGVIPGVDPGKQRILATLSSGSTSAPHLYWTDVAI